MSNELEEFEKYLDAESEIILDKVSKDIEATLKSKVQKNVYNVYKPFYNRRFQLRDKIKISRNDREAIISWQGQQYINNQGEDVSNFIPQWINDGFRHKNWNGREDKYHLRSKSNFLEDTVNEINKKYKDEVCKRVDW